VKDCGKRAVLVVTREVRGTSTNVASRRVELSCGEPSGHAGAHRDLATGVTWEGDGDKVPTVLRHESPEA